MALEILTAEEAHARAKENPIRIYPRRGRDEARLVPVARPAFAPRFRMAETDRIFAAGSCFARHIEKALRYVGMNVVSSPTDIDAPKGAPEPFQLFNKYSVDTILNELRWAAQGDSGAAADASLIEGPGGRVCDLQVTAAVTGSWDEMRQFRAAYSAAFAPALAADVLIVTLGLAETWFDRETGLTLNAAPPKSLVAAYPGRFEFRVLDYGDILSGLFALHDLLTRQARTMPKLLLTVSPVPLVTTFRDQDILVANTYSKAVQRAAVDAFVAQTDAAYFPSYEYVSLTDNRFAWADKDFRHVRPETVDRIMADVLGAYLGPSAGQSLLDARARGALLLSVGEDAAALEVVEAHMSRHGEDADLLWIWVRALRSAKRYPEMLTGCRKIAELGGERVQPAIRTALNVARQTEDRAAFAEFEGLHRRLLPDDAAFLCRFESAGPSPN